MINKEGEIREGLTPREERPELAGKTAQQQPLESHATQRIADAVKDDKAKQR